jgi:hypothetical protein
MTRDELFNLMDSPTVAAIARVFDPQYQRPGQSYSEQIVSILEASLALRSQGANATLPLHLDERRMLADRLRWIYQQKDINLTLAAEVCNKLEEIIFHLDAGSGTPPVSNDGITRAMEVVANMRQSEAGLFDAKHSGQRGCDRSDALYDAYVAIRALLPREEKQ